MSRYVGVWLLSCVLLCVLCGYCLCVCEWLKVTCVSFFCDSCVQVCVWVYLCVRVTMYYPLLSALWIAATTPIFPLTVRLVFWQKNCISRPEQQMWADKISLDYEAHFTVSLTLDTPVPWLVRHADGDGEGAAVLSYPSLSVAFAKGTCRKP